MIEFHLHQVAARHGITNAYQFEQAMITAGVRAPASTFYRMWKGAPKRKRIEFDWLDSLCAALKCLPADLLVYVPASKKRK
jgi:DNA-binding Xre family transcriptional regulator